MQFYVLLLKLTLLGKQFLKLKKTYGQLGVLVHIFNPRTPEAEQADACEFEAQLLLGLSGMHSETYSQKRKQNKTYGYH